MEPMVADLTDLITRLDIGRFAAAIDIPIGIRPICPRRCEVEARKITGQGEAQCFPHRSGAYWKPEPLRSSV